MCSMRRNRFNGTVNAETKRKPFTFRLFFEVALPIQKAKARETRAKAY